MEELEKRRKIAIIVNIVLAIIFFSLFIAKVKAQTKIQYYNLYQLNHKTIQSAKVMNNTNKDVLVLEFTDGTSATIESDKYRMTIK